MASNELTVFAVTLQNTVIPYNYTLIYFINNERTAIKGRIFLYQAYQTQEINHKNPRNSQNHISSLSINPPL
jgi:hypothetical protein